MPRLAHLPADSGLIEKLQAINHPLFAPEVAALFRSTRDTVYRLARKGVIPSYRFGGGVRFDPLELALCLRGTTVGVQ